MFRFANASYNNVSEWCVRKISGGSSYQVYLDIHGRKVLRYYERYPCFDSSDFLYEDRGYHYFYIKQKDDFACLYYDDGRGEIKIYASQNMPVKVVRTILQKELQQDW